MTKPHGGSSEYVHFAKYRLDSYELKDICTAFPQSGVGVMYANDLTTAIPQTGYIELAGRRVWAQNCEKQGHIYLWYRSSEDQAAIVQAAKAAKEAQFAGVENKVYRLSANGIWLLTESHITKSRSNVVGYDDYIDTMSNDIADYKEHLQFLRGIGETRSLNYLLFGEPGTGKTSTVLLLACLHKLPVYVVGKMSRQCAFLTPPGEGLRILVFEDFDRYLQGAAATQSADKPVDQTGHMADILNSMDGINSGEGVIRIFTGNDCDIVFQNEALINRMSGCFKFSAPTKNMFITRLRTLLTDKIAPEDEQRIMELVQDIPPGTTFRPFVSFVIRHMFKPQCLKHMLNNLDQLSTTPPK